MSKNTMKRILLTAVAALMLVTLTIGGTLAWLTDTTTEVVNTFEATGIDIELIETMKPDGTETDADNDGKNDAVTDWKVDLIPGKTYKKNPTVSVVRPTTDVDIFVFVKYEYTTSIPALTYESTLTSNNGWTQVGVTTVDDENGITTEVWGRVVGKDDTVISWHMLKDDQVSIAQNVTQTQTATGGTLKWTAYAIQTEGFYTISTDNDGNSVTTYDYQQAYTTVSSSN